MVRHILPPELNGVAGKSAWSIVVSSVGVLTLWPLIDTITSPGTALRPQRAFPAIPPRRTRR